MQSKGTVALVGGAQLVEIRRALARRGLRAIALDVPEAIGAIPDDPVILSYEEADYSHTLTVTRRLIELGKHHGLRAIVPVSEYGLLASAMAARQLGLPAQPLAVVIATRDKLRMRRMLARAGVPQPRWSGCRTEEEARAFQRELGGPIVVKPALGSGSEAVTLVAEEGDLADAFARIKVSRPAGPVLCEEFVEGPEVSLEACTINGRFIPVALTDKRTGQGFIETGHQQPSAHSEAVQQEIFALTETILAELGLDQAVSHTEFRLSAGGPMLIETHTRMGGDRIHVLTEQTQGVDLADLTVGLALGERPKVSPQATGRGCAISFLMGGPGCVESIAQPPDPTSGVLATDVGVEVGAIVGECRSSFERLASVTAVGPTAELAAGIAARHLARIEIQWSDESYERRAANERLQ